jgi:hypothetical protein
MFEGAGGRAERMADSPPSFSNNRIAMALAVVITVAWALSFFIDIVVKVYDPPASVHALMMIVAGAVFGEGLLKTRGDNQPPDKEKE